MSKLLSVLIAAVFAVVTFSAVAEDAAMAPAKPASKTPSPKQLAQRAKMKLCNKEARENGLQKAERKAFMKSCLKKDSSEPSAQ